MALTEATLEAVRALAEREEERAGVGGKDGGEIVGGGRKSALNVGLTGSEVAEEVMVGSAVRTLAGPRRSRVVAKANLASSGFVVEFAVLRGREKAQPSSLRSDDV
jgi:hypothetical protein